MRAPHPTQSHPAARTFNLAAMQPMNSISKNPSRKRMRLGASATAALLAACFASAAHAGLFIGKGSNMAMNIYTPTLQEMQWLYGINREVSAGGTYTRVAEPDHEQELASLQANYLVGRWMTPTAVGNLYVTGNIGQHRTTRTLSAGHLHPGAAPQIQRQSGTMAGWGIWADYETRQIYTRLSTARWRTGSLDSSHTVAQVGVSPYKAEYDEIAPWFVVQVEEKRGIATGTQVTPMLRFIYKRWWFELGGTTSGNNKGDLYLNLMHVF
jgi:hypothetical protein